MENRTTMKIMWTVNNGLSKPFSSPQFDANIIFVYARTNLNIQVGSKFQKQTSPDFSCKAYAHTGCFVKLLI